MKKILLLVVLLLAVVSCVPNEPEVTKADFDALVAAVEDLANSVGAVADTVGAVNDKVAALQLEVGVVAGDVEDLDDAVGALDNRLDALEAVPSATPVPTKTPAPSATPAPEHPVLWVVVTDAKAVLREICGESKGKPQFNAKGYPIMCVYSSDGTVGGRIKYLQDDVLAIYADGDALFFEEYGVQTYGGGALIRTDGNDYYYMVAGPRGESLFVPAWDVSTPVP